MTDWPIVRVWFDLSWLASWGEDSRMRELYPWLAPRVEGVLARPFGHAARDPHLITSVMSEEIFHLPTQAVEHIAYSGTRRHFFLTELPSTLVLGIRSELVTGASGEQVLTVRGASPDLVRATFFSLWNRESPEALWVPGQKLKDALKPYEAAIIAEVLRYFNGNRKNTADALRINRTTLFNKMRKYGLLDEESASRANRA